MTRIPVRSFRTGASRLVLALVSSLVAYTPCVYARFVLHEVADGAFVHQGRHEDYSPANRGDIANIGFVIGDRCVAVIDSGGSLTVGLSLFKALRRITKKPVCYVISTHGHPDHFLGNNAFLSERPVYVAHAAMKDYVLQNREYFLNHFLQPLGQRPPAETIQVPERLIEGEERIDLGRRTLILRTFPAAHTSQDLTVFDLTTRTLWTGDLLFVDRIPALEGSLKGWLNVVSQLKAVPALRAVPGHGPAKVAWPNALQAESRYLGSLLTGIKDCLAQGCTLEHALTAVGQTERHRWLLFDRYHKRNVTRAYTELEWD